MTRTIETALDIDAPAERVWSALTEFESLPEWSRFILSIEGEAREGAQLTVRLDDGGRPMTVRPRLTVLQARRELRWLGSLGLKSLFAGEHYFRLEPLADGRTRLTHGEHFSGMLLPLLWSKLDKGTRRAFGQFNEALRDRAQALAATGAPTPTHEVHGAATDPSASSH